MEDDDKVDDFMVVPAGYGSDIKKAEIVDRDDWFVFLKALACIMMDEDYTEKINDILEPMTERLEKRFGKGWMGEVCDAIEAHEKGEKRSAVFWTYPV